MPVGEIQGQVEGGGSGTITYALAPRAGDTTFKRALAYTAFNPLLALLDRLVLRRAISAESAEALLRLKRALEEGTE